MNSGEIEILWPVNTRRGRDIESRRRNDGWLCHILTRQLQVSGVVSFACVLRNSAELSRQRHHLSQQQIQSTYVPHPKELVINCLLGHLVKYGEFVGAILRHSVTNLTCITFRIMRMRMNLHNLSKMSFSLIFVVFSVLFIISIIIGATGSLQQNNDRKLKKNQQKYILLGPDVFISADVENFTPGLQWAQVKISHKTSIYLDLTFNFRTVHCGRAQLQDCLNSIKSST